MCRPLCQQACTEAALQHIHTSFGSKDSSELHPLRPLPRGSERLQVYVFHCQLQSAADSVVTLQRSLILGWSDKVIAIVNQLCNANESEGGLPIVILSEQEKVCLHGRHATYVLALNRLAAVLQIRQFRLLAYSGVDGRRAGQARHQSAWQPHHLQVHVSLAMALRRP